MLQQPRRPFEITFNKVWEGDSGHEDERPSSLTLAVSNANTGALVKEVTLTAAENWTTTETLPYVTDSDGHFANTVVEKKKPEAYDYSVSTLIWVGVIVVVLLVRWLHRRRRPRHFA